MTDLVDHFVRGRLAEGYTPDEIATDRRGVGFLRWLAAQRGVVVSSDDIVAALTARLAKAKP